MIENIHSEMYAKLIENLIKDTKEKHDLFNAIETMPAVAKKGEFLVFFVSVKIKVFMLSKILSLINFNSNPLRSRVIQNFSLLVKYFPDKNR